MTVSKVGTGKLLEEVEWLAKHIEKTHGVQLGAAFPDKMTLDALASPRQNPFSVRYLSRIDDKTDSMNLHQDFWSFKFNAFRVESNEYRR